MYPEVNVEVPTASLAIPVPPDRRRSHLDDAAGQKAEVSGHRPLHRINAKRSISSPTKSAR